MTGDAVVAETARRSRLSPERETELYQAVIDLVSEVGYDAMTMDAVAARSHASKATLYRQWQGKPQLVAAAMRHIKFVALDLDTGSLRGDLYELAGQIGRGAEGETVFMNAIGHAIHRDPELGVAMRETLITPFRQVLRELLERAVARGEVRADAAALDFFAYALFGALPARKILDDRFADTEFLLSYVDAVVLPALLHS